MTFRQPSSRPRWALSFLAAIVAVLTIIGLAATASAATTGTAETRVGASAVVVEPLVGPPEHITAGQRLGNDPARVVTTVATGVAAKFEDGAFRLIGANRATIDPRKLTEYALNPNHPVGGNKARVFESALGFNRSNADDLMAQLRRGVTENKPIPGKVDKWGTRFTVDIPVTGPAGSGIVRTGWIYTPGSTTPSLNTLMVR